MAISADRCVKIDASAVNCAAMGVSEHLNAGIIEKTNFYQYFDLIDEKISPNKLPFRSRLIALNKLRVNAKHVGLVPARSAVSGLPTTVREFFEEVSVEVFDRPLATISLIDLIKDAAIRTFLEEAETMLRILANVAGSFLATKWRKSRYSPFPR